MSIRLLIVFGATSWAACVSGRVGDATGAPISKVRVTLESQSESAGEAIGAEDGSFRICTNLPGEYRIVAKAAGFHRRTTPSFDLHRDRELAALAMRINMDDVVCKLPILANPRDPYPYFDASGKFVQFTGRDGERRKFARLPADRQYALDGGWKHVVFIRGNEIWVDQRRVYSRTSPMWEPEFTADG